MEALAIELLGPPTIRTGGEDRRPVAGRQRALLALLALRAPRPVTADVLVDALWGDELPADPTNALQQRISSLRKQLGGDVLATAPGAYALRLPADAVDLRRFERLVGRGRELLRDGDPAGARTELDAALALWRGDALDGVAHEPWAIAEARRLEELRLAATEDRTEAALATGRGDDLVPELARRVEEHPLRERSVAQLMLALLRADRQADALDLFDRTRRRLADELGADPGPNLRAAHRRVLDHGSDRAPEPPSAHRAAAGTSPCTPVPRGPLIGRDAMLELLDELLDTHRLVTVLGPGGAGKTALAVALVARRAPPRHGSRWVDLAVITDGAAVVGEVARQLEVGPRGLSAGGVDASAVVAAVRDHELLLVLDDAAPWRDEVAALVEELLDGAPSVQVVVTSRVPLGVAGERRVPLPGLDAPALGEDDATTATAPAVQLLVERARAHDPWFDLDTGAVAAAGELVRRLDGLPLAIELAAARLRTRTVTEVLDELAAGDALADPERRGPDRHRSLDAVLSGTWQDLSPAGRAAWAALSVAAGPIDGATADALVGAAGVLDPRRAVTELTDRALVAVDRGTGSVEVRTLGTVRRFGRERLGDLPVGPAVRRAHADRVEAALEATVRHDDPSRFPVDLTAQARWLDEARAVLGAAEVHGDHDRLQRIAGRLGWTWLLRGLAGEGLRWLERGLAIDDRHAARPDHVDPDRVDPDAALWASGLRLGGADPLGAGWAELARQAARTDADRVAAGVHAAVHAVHAGDVTTCAERLAEADVVATAIGGWPLGFHRLVRAQIGRLVGQVGTVRRDAEAALAALTDPAAAWARALAVDVLIDALLEEAGSPTPAAVHEQARRSAAEALTWCVDAGQPELESRLRLQLGRALHGLGEVDLGRRHLEEAVALARSAGAPVSLGFALLQAGTVARDRGDPAAAAGAFAEAEELLRGTGAAFGMVEAGVLLADALRATDRHLDADAAARRALAAAADAGDEALIARAGAAVAADDRPATGG